MTDNRAFRDYATRVSFNMTLSRNQIGQLRQIVIEIEHQELSFEERTGLISEARDASFPDNFIAGRRSLQNMGLIMNDPRRDEEAARSDAARAAGDRYLRQYWGPSYMLTDAGQHVVALLRIAGLIHPAIANTNKKKRKAS